MSEGSSVLLPLLPLLISAGGWWDADRPNRRVSDGNDQAVDPADF